MDIETLEKEFTSIFKINSSEVYFSPGRINVIGEHTDYNGGHVFPCAISLGTYGVVSPRDDKIVGLYSANFPDAGVISFDLNSLEYDSQYGWGNYVRGMMYELKKHHDVKFDHGFNLYIHGNLPDGAGLSSSASLEILTGTILNDMFNLQLEKIDLVYAGQQTENDYIGLNSGIMDQFAIAMGKKDQAIFLDTNTMEYEYYPLDLGNNVVLIMNSNKAHELANSKYNERRAQCEEALKRIQSKLAIKALGELTKEQFDLVSYLINDDVLLKRARHAVFENQRTIDAKNALKDRDLIKLGHLISASHISLEYDYEVSVNELDTLASTAWNQDGVLGARIIGGGFGGCAIAIVDKDRVNNVRDIIAKKYVDEFGYKADFYIAKISEGAGKIS